MMKVLVAVDDSVFAALATEEIAARPWPRGTCIRVLNVVPTILPVSTAPVVTTMETERRLLEAATRLTEAACESLRRRDLQAESRVREGDAAAMILEEAGEWSADLIIVGSHGHSAIERVVLGSTALHVVTHAGCSVEVARRKATTAKR